MENPNSPEIVRSACRDLFDSEEEEEEEIDDWDPVVVEPPFKWEEEHVPFRSMWEMEEPPPLPDLEEYDDEEDEQS